MVILVLSMGNMLFLAHGILCCSTSSRHWEKSACCHVASPVSSSYHPFVCALNGKMMQPIKLVGGVVIPILSWEKILLYRVAEKLQINVSLRGLVSRGQYFSLSNEETRQPGLIPCLYFFPLCRFVFFLFLLQT